MKESGLLGAVAVQGLDRLVHDSIQIRAQAIGIDARGAARRLDNYGSRHEPPLWNRAKLSHRHPISGDGDRLTGLHLAEYRAGVVTELALGNGPAHGKREEHLLHGVAIIVRRVADRTGLGRRM